MIGAHSDFPFAGESGFSVHQGVVGSAEQDQVVHDGWSSFGPVFDVVGVGPGGDAVAAGEGAPFVSGDQGGALCCGDKPFEWGDIEWGTVSVEEDAGEHAVTGDHAGAADAQWSHPGHVADIEILFVEIVKVEIEHAGIVVLGRDRC